MQGGACAAVFGGVGGGVEGCREGAVRLMFSCKHRGPVFTTGRRTTVTHRDILSVIFGFFLTGNLFVYLGIPTPEVGAGLVTNHTTLNFKSPSMFVASFSSMHGATICKDPSLGPPLCTTFSVFNPSWTTSQQLASFTI